MSKFRLLWEYIQKSNQDSLVLTFLEIENIIVFPIDHSFLNYKKELLSYGYQVCKISLKEQKVFFNRVEKNN